MSKDKINEITDALCVIEENLEDFQKLIRIRFNGFKLVLDSIRSDIESIKNTEDEKVILDKIEKGFPPGTSLMRAGAPWTEREDDILLRAFCNFMKKQADIHCRTYGAINSRMRKFFKENLDK